MNFSIDATGIMGNFRNQIGFIIRDKYNITIYQRFPG